MYQFFGQREVGRGWALLRVFCSLALVLSLLSVRVGSKTTASPAFFGVLGSKDLGTFLGVVSLFVILGSLTFYRETVHRRGSYVAATSLMGARLFVT